VAVVSVVLLPSKLLPKLICSLSANLLATYKNTRTETFAQFACNVMLGADHLTRIMAGYVGAFPRRLYKFGWIIAVLAHAAIKPKAHSCQLDN